MEPGIKNYLNCQKEEKGKGEKLVRCIRNADRLKQRLQLRAMEPFCNLTMREEKMLMQIFFNCTLMQVVMLFKENQWMFLHLSPFLYWVGEKPSLSRVWSLVGISNVWRLWWNRSKMCVKTPHQCTFHHFGIRASKYQSGLSLFWIPKVIFVSFPLILIQFIHKKILKISTKGKNSSISVSCNYFPVSFCFFYCFYFHLFIIALGEFSLLLLFKKKICCVWNLHFFLLLIALQQPKKLLNSPLFHLKPSRQHLDMFLQMAANLSCCNIWIKFDISTVLYPDLIPRPKLVPSQYLTAFIAAHTASVLSQHLTLSITNLPHFNWTHFPNSTLSASSWTRPGPILPISNAHPSFLQRPFDFFPYPRLSTIEPHNFNHALAAIEQYESIFCE